MVILKHPGSEIDLLWETKSVPAFDAEIEGRERFYDCTTEQQRRELTSAAVNSDQAGHRERRFAKGVLDEQHALRSGNTKACGASGTLCAVIHEQPCRTRHERNSQCSGSTRAPSLRSTGTEEDEMSPQDTYRRGIEDRQVAGSDPTPYDLILAGLTAVLAECGVETSTSELDSLFHYPLASTPVDTPLVQVAGSIVTALPEPREEKHDLYPYLRRYYTPATDEEEAKRQLAWLDNAGENIHAAAAKRRAEAAMNYRRAEIAETLLLVSRVVTAALFSEIGQIALCRCLAKSMEDESTNAESWVESTRAAIEERLREIPVERAKSVRPLSELRLNARVFGRGYGGNLGEEGRYVSDGSVVFDSERVVGAEARKRAKRLAGKEAEKFLSQDRLVQHLAKMDNEAEQEEATVYGFLSFVPPRRRRTWKLAVLVFGDSKVVYADADYVRLLDSLYKNRLDVRIHTDEDGQKMIAFYLDDGIVAALAPTSFDFAIDVQTLFLRRLQHALRSSPSTRTERQPVGTETQP